jgi:hypothetical protein
VSTLYRSPNIIIDAHEWHLAVEDDSRLNGNRDRRSVIQYKWRPVSDRPLPWKTIAQWVGPKPKSFNQRFMKPYRRHAELAMKSDLQRGEAVKLLRVQPSGAMLRNPGELVVA